MLRLASDADVHGDIIKGVRLRDPSLDLVRVQEVGLRTAKDPVILDWAASEGRILVSQDRSTMIGEAYERVKLGLPMPGLIILGDWMTFHDAIEGILLVAHCCGADELRNTVKFLPL